MSYKGMLAVCTFKKHIAIHVYLLKILTWYIWRDMYGYMVYT